MGVIYRYRLNMTPGGVPLVVHVNQYDEMFTLIFDLYALVNGTQFTIPEDTTAMVQGTKTDGCAYDADCYLDRETKQVIVDGDPQMTASAGKNIFEIKLINDGRALYSSNFILDVEPAAMDANSITDESVLKEMNALIESASVATEAAESAAASAEAAAESAASLVIDDTLSIAGRAADAKKTGDRLSALESVNADDFFASKITWPNTTKNGVTFAANSDGKSVHVSGTSSATTSVNLVSGGQTTIPSGFEAGKTYYAEVTNGTGNYNIGLVITYYITGGGSKKVELYKGSTEFTLPADLAGMYVQLYLKKDNTFNGNWTCSIIEGIPNQELLDDIKAVGNANALYNASDFFRDIVIWPNVEKSGVQVAKCHDGGVYLSGTSTAASNTGLVTGGASVIPAGFTAGMTHYVRVIDETGAANGVWPIIKIYSDGAETDTYEIHDDTYEIDVPDDLAGVEVLLHLESGKTFAGRWNLAITTDVPNYKIPEIAAQVSTDKTLSITDKPADAKAAGDAVGALKTYNAYDIFPDIATLPNETKNGVTFTRNADGKSINLTGTASASTREPLVAGGTTTIPAGFEAGRTYYVKPTNLTGNADVALEVTTYSSANGSSKTTIKNGDAEIRMPADLVGVIIQIYVPNATSVSGSWTTIITKELPNSVLLDNLTALEDQIDVFNASDFFHKCAIWPGTVRNGVTYTKARAGNGVYLNGTCTTATTMAIVTGGATTIPAGFKAGKRHYVRVVNQTGVSGENVGAIIKVYSTSMGTETYTIYGGHLEIDVPADLAGVNVQITVAAGQTYNGFWAVLITTDIPNYMISEEGGGNTYNYEITNVEQTVNVSASPSIEVTADCYLAASSDPTTDRTAEILAMLASNGYCKLSKGTFAVSGLVMPNDTRLEGSGLGTVLRLPDSVTDGFVVSMRNYDIVSDLRISGGDTSYKSQSTIGTRNGIIWQGTLNDQDECVNVPRYGFLHNVYIDHFSGSGLLCQYTGTSSIAAFTASDVWISYCSAGLNIWRRSEYHHFENVKSMDCYYGLINNGGNNCFANCDFSRNRVGVTMDNSDGSAANNAHGSMVGCTINHNGTDNDGYAFVIKNMRFGFVFDACNVFYGKIHVEDSLGMLFTNLNTGTVSLVEVEDSASVLFLGCLFNNQPTFTIANSINVKAENCYVRSTGAAVTIS